MDPVRTEQQQHLLHRVENMVVPFPKFSYLSCAPVSDTETEAGFLRASIFCTSQEVSIYMQALLTKTW